MSQPEKTSATKKPIKKDINKSNRRSHYEKMGKYDQILSFLAYPYFQQSIPD
jgi:hypothetical protein